MKIKEKTILILFFIFALLIFTNTVYASERYVGIDVETGKIVDSDPLTDVSAMEEIISNTTTSSNTEVSQPTYDTNDIFNTDDRYQIYDTTSLPYSAISRLTAIEPYSESTVTTTATMVSDNIALTAAHCIYQTALGGVFHDVTITPGANGDAQPFGQSNVSTVYVSPIWIEKNGSTDMDEVKDSYNYDWAILILDEDLGDYSGYLNFKCYSNYLNLFNLTIKLTGYPHYTHDSEHNSIDHNFLYQFEGTGIIDTAFSKRIEYTVDTSPGQSGAPVLNTSNTIVGIHGGPYWGADTNRGVRIYSDLYDLINEKISSY